MPEIQTVQTKYDLNGGEFISLPLLYCHQRQAKPCIRAVRGGDLSGHVHNTINKEKFHDQFAVDVPVAETKLMAGTQRPITEAALNEGSGEAAWKSIPSWFIYGDRDLNIPAAVNAFMADRANSKETIAVAGASHVMMISHPNAVAKLIEKAASAN